VKLRVKSDNQGYSAFWDALGKNIFFHDFQKSDYLSRSDVKTFIRRLMAFAYPI